MSPELYRTFKMALVTCLKDRFWVHSCFLYVNDMCSVVNCKLLLYANDTARIVPGKYVKEIELQLTKELKSISNWLTDNTLSLHLCKTESILFGTKKKLQCTSSQLNVMPWGHHQLTTPYYSTQLSLVFSW